MTTETGYREPDAAAVGRLVDEVLTAAGDPARAATAAWVRSGSSSLVVLGERTAVRVARDPHAAPELLRAQRLVDALPYLPFAVPRSVGEVAVLDGVTAVPVRRLGGTPHEPGSGDPVELRRLLVAIHTIDPTPLEGLLARPRAFYGGDRWYEVLAEDAVPLLPATLRAAARDAVDRLAAAEVPVSAVGHGDLAGANVLWDGGRVVGVLDWDLASVDDPAEDVASLAGWHGWDLAPALADPATVERAALFRAVAPLTVVAFALLRGRPDEEVARAVARAAERLPGRLPG
ncbi:phosphotransferase family protein [Luteimicrobium sp. DT211]|uniref:phosphotransferase family protein n=1 Tax=Luteimicrobium sp. DT211 TaxID=3393412 RepID=UPI003CE8EE60